MQELPYRTSLVMLSRKVYVAYGKGERMTTPNYELLLSSTITSLKIAYSKYKNAVISSLEWTWIDSDGSFVILAGAEERNENISKLWKEVQRLQFKVEEIKKEIEESDTE